MKLKSVFVVLITFLFNYSFAQKDKVGMGVEYNTRPISSEKQNGILITPTYILEGDYSVQLSLIHRHLIGIGLTKDGPLRKEELLPRNDNDDPYLGLATTQPMVGFSFLYHYRKFFAHEYETMGWYGGTLLRVRKYVTEITSFDEKPLNETIRDKSTWINFGYQIGYLKTFNSKWIIDIYGGLGCRLEFNKEHYVDFNNYSYLGATTPTFYETRDNAVRFILNTGIRLGYAF
ncbi:MAG: hypothetical protein MUE33_00825 [Cytophagaceae bacterium]|jgi:hypothetical protein|nr:hypothetical protein [Cytophagaceae bacterium]